jgi:DNA-binding response OmpR family regulator
MRVLLADTDDIFLEIVQSFLWDRGHEAEIATDGLECISILREFVPDALVIDRDLVWGGPDGVLDLMAEDRLLSNIPVILTADGRIDDELLARSGLPIACLTKPYRLGELLAHLNEAGRFRPFTRSLVETI